MTLHYRRQALPMRLLLPAAGLIIGGLAIDTSPAQEDLPPDGTSVLAPDALLTTPVGGLERTRGTREIETVTGKSFDRSLRVTTGIRPPESNATQLNLVTIQPVASGDALLASFHVRGVAANGHDPARTEFIFEETVRPWTKSVTRGVATLASPDQWKRVLIPFVSAGSYRPGEAMVSLRFGFDPQTIELAGLQVMNYAKARTFEELQAATADRSPLGRVTVTVDLQDTQQIMEGFGGNFAQPRYGSREPMDTVGQYNLDHLRVVHARVGIPLNHWTPEPGVYRDDGPARAALQQMQTMAARGIPITGSVWEGPLWMLPGTREQPRTLPREQYETCMEAMAQFLVAARDRYGATVDYVSFNEPDFGVNFRFSPVQMAEFIRLAGPRFAELGLPTRFLTADTANGMNFADYARPLLEDEGIAPYLGPLAFHGWDALNAPASAYTAIAALGRQYRKPVWCTEAGHDSGLWRTPNPWPAWENALRTALAYVRTLRLSGASRMDYWTYQDNYPLLDENSAEPYPVWHVMHQMEQVLSPGARVATAIVGHDDLQALPTVGPEPGRFALLLVNPNGPGQAAIAGLPTDATFIVVQSTSAAQGETVEAAMRTDGTGTATVALPARSVVTVLSTSP